MFLNSKVIKHKDIYDVIYIPAINANKQHDLIKPHIPLSMAYKLPKKL